MKNYEDAIIQAINRAYPGLTGALSGEMRFCDIAGVDSMSIVVMQMELVEIVGPVAERVTPILDMTISEYSAALSAGE